MFTGIVTDIGEVIALERQGDLKARIATAYPAAGIDIGASIACDGCCLTVIATGTEPRNWFDVQISAESIAKTNIGSNRVGWAPGRRLNLERALKVGDELGGHIVSGHIDAVATIESITPEEGSQRFVVAAPENLMRFVAPKGSVTLDGVSLTVNEVKANTFGVNIIPHTQAVTTFGALSSGSRVNMEIDVIARYVARVLQPS